MSAALFTPPSLDGDVAISTIVVFDTIVEVDSKLDSTLFVNVVLVVSTPFGRLNGAIVVVVVVGVDVDVVVVVVVVVVVRGGDVGAAVQP